MGLPKLHLSLLGPFEARLDNGRTIEIKLKRARLLLAWLAVRPKESGSREEIAALLWGERSDAQAHQSLRQTLAVIRSALDEHADAILQIDRETIALAADAVVSDVVLLARSNADSPIEDLERAVAHYGGEFLEGVTIRDPFAQEWLQGRRSELRNFASRRFEWLLTAYAKAGRHTDAEPIARRLIEIDPLAEEGHRALIRASLATGKRAMAIRQYQRCRDILARELSVEPAAETKELLRRATDPLPADAGQPTPQLHDEVFTRTDRSHNLPRQMTSLVGRDGEVSDVLARLRRYRLVTLTGPGGAGKTRISIDVGLRQVATQADGVWLVEFAAIANPQLLGEALCSALGVPVASDRPALESAITYLGQKELLLILDNCEHIVSAAARMAEAILRECPSVSILATSRESLAVPGESLYRVPSLPFPTRTDGITPAAALSYSAVQLFVDRAIATVDGFALDASTAPAVASICRQVEGIPLAIELAGRPPQDDAPGMASRQSERLLPYIARRGPCRATAPPDTAHHARLEL
jgi:DNA-binding SARP family transcriptional activator